MSLVLQIIGCVIVAAGLSMLAPWRGVTALGFGVLLIGIGKELDDREVRTRGTG